jgi:hypothetical protein
MPQSTTRRKAQQKAPPAPEKGQLIGADFESVTGELVHVPRDEPPAIYVAMDQLDEQQIVAEIMGAYDSLVDALVYEFDAGTGDQRKTVRGISYTGVNWCVREMAKRGIGRIGVARNPVTGNAAVTYEETTNPDGNPVYEVTVVAIDNALGTENAGMADQPLYPTKRDGTTYTDPHAKRKALSKAQRNAKQGLIPEDLKAELMASVKGAQIKRVQTPRQAAEGAANQAGQQRAQNATAAPPKVEIPSTAAQQRGVMAKARESGVDPAGVVFKAILSWVGKTRTLDRLPKDRVNAVREALADADAIVAEIVDAARDETHPDHEPAKIMAPALAAASGGEAAAGEPAAAQQGLGV